MCLGNRPPKEKKKTAPVPAAAPLPQDVPQAKPGTNTGNQDDMNTPLTKGPVDLNPGSTSLSISRAGTPSGIGLN